VRAGWRSGLGSCCWPRTGCRTRRSPSRWGAVQNGDRVARAAPGPVVACTQPSVQPDRNARSANRKLRTVSTARPRSEATTHRNPMVRRRRPSSMASQALPRSGSCPSNRSVATPASVVGGQRVGLEDDLNDHRNGVPSANHHSATSRQPRLTRPRDAGPRQRGASHEWDESRLCRGPGESTWPEARSSGETYVVRWDGDTQQEPAA
jgi:hypothetical protein